MSTKKDKFSAKDQLFMEIALDLAKAREGLTHPNPSVGCVITKNNEIISIGQTSVSGRPHAELNAIKNLFDNDSPMISSTKSMTGHSLGATGAHEAIYSIMMINENFIAPSINIESLCDEAQGLNIVTSTKDVAIDNILSNSFGFGGTNASLVVSRY